MSPRVIAELSDQVAGSRIAVCDSMSSQVVGHISPQANATVVTVALGIKNVCVVSRVRYKIVI